MALGFGVTSGTTEAMESEMNCQCALSYHNSLNQGFVKKDYNLHYYFERKKKIREIDWRIYKYIE